MTMIQPPEVTEDRIATSIATAGTDSLELSTSSGRHPILRFVLRRLGLAVVTVFVVSVIVFVATAILPGNAARAVLGRNATPASLKAMELKLHLDHSALWQYWHWFSGLLHGNLGTSLVNGQTVTSLLGDRVVNSLILVVLAGVIGTALAIVIGLLSAVRAGKLFDDVVGVITLTFAALPEFVIAITMVILFATVVWHILPPVSLIPPGSFAWSTPEILILPVATLILATCPYVIRMMRASALEVLESEYVAMAVLKGLTPARILIRHVIPNALASTVQVIAIVFAWLAGGIVLVEYVFNYPGVGQALIDAVDNRDIPVIQALTVMLAAFYVIMNLVADLSAVLLSSRTRTSMR
jgi:peptide/nickel transport system permease protein